MDLGLKGRKVLVTGASQGMGEGIAVAFAREGCELFLVARSAENLARVADLTRKAGATTHVLAADLTEPGAMERVMEFAGEADVLVNNAGVTPAGTLWEVDEAKWRAGWELKVFGYINLTRLMYPTAAAAASATAPPCASCRRCMRWAPSSIRRTHRSGRTTACTKPTKVYR